MIARSLSSIRNQLNAYLHAKEPDYHEQDPAIVSDLLDPEGEFVLSQLNRNQQDNIVISLINVEEETVGKNQIYYHENPDGSVSAVNPKLKVNLFVMLSAFSGGAAAQRYENCLRLLSYVLRFFQHKPLFTHANTPDLPDEVDKLTVELVSPTFEEQNHLWAALGANYMPSLVYKIRMLTIHETEEALLAPLIQEVEIQDVTIS